MQAHITTEKSINDDKRERESETETDKSLIILRPPEDNAALVAVLQFMYAVQVIKPLSFLMF